MPISRPLVLVLAIFVIAAPTAGRADSPCTGIVEQYLGRLVAGESEAAFDALMKHSRLDEAKPLEIQHIRGQIEQAFRLYGAPTAFEQVLRKQYGSSLIRLVYITKHRDLPLIWNFNFYKTGDTWLLLNFPFNDQLQQLE